MAGLVMGVDRYFSELPDRTAQADAVAPMIATPVRVDSTGARPFRLAGAWELESSEPRLGGLSALAMDGQRLVALTDSGVVVRFGLPGASTSAAHFHDLPDGPGNPRHKSRRDSEALTRLADGDWLVAFENRDQIWRFDADFRSGRRAMSFARNEWPINRGIEAMAVDAEGVILALPESDESIVTVGDVTEHYPLASDGWTVSDATRLPDGRLFVLLRRITVTGFRNAIGELLRNRAGWRVAVRARLPLGALDNGEGLAAQALSDGETRLWIVTDNDFAGYRRTLLVALDLPARRRAG